MNEKEDWRIVPVSSDENSGDSREVLTMNVDDIKAPSALPD
ncbi:MAG: hypothetical protein K0R55_3319 [Sporomusa sp.]|jgi:hypothetical protein|nr:hypothetical protein [Sporomusa sp.]